MTDTAKPNPRPPSTGAAPKPEEKEPAEKILYVAEEDGKKRLIKASSEAAATKFVYKPKIHRAKPNEVAELFQAGVKIEEA